jgi:hypothetical protein
MEREDGYEWWLNKDKVIIVAYFKARAVFAKKIPSN